VTTVSLTSLFSRHIGDPKPGDGFASTARTITETDIVSFAALTGDWHPQHIDRVWAKRSVFGQRIAHGMLVASYATALVPLDPHRVVALRAVETTFKRPVRIGDTIHVEGECTKVRGLDESYLLVDSTWRVINQASEVVVRMKVRVLWRTERARDRVESEAEESDVGGGGPYL
jgi:acyl dehydratase